MKLLIFILLCIVAMYLLVSCDKNDAEKVAYINNIECENDILRIHDIVPGTSHDREYTLFDQSGLEFKVKVDEIIEESCAIQEKE